jgi:hypothetical protein
MYSPFHTAWLIFFLSHSINKNNKHISNIITFKFPWIKVFLAVFVWIRISLQYPLLNCGKRLLIWSVFQMRSQKPRSCVTSGLCKDRDGNLLKDWWMANLEPGETSSIKHLEQHGHWYCMRGDKMVRRSEHLGVTRFEMMRELVEQGACQIE